jgi:DNA polymerase-3 subunit gamma/tau
LDQLSLLAGTITPEKVWDLVGAVPEKDLLKLMQAIAANQPQTVIEQCRYLMNRGREPLVVLQNLASFYLNLLIAKTAPNRPDMVAVTSPTWQVLCEEAKRWNLEIILQGQKHLKDSEIQLKNTSQPRLWLEVTLLSLLASAHQPIAQPQVNLKTAAPQQETPPISPQPTPIQPPPIKTEIPQPKPSQETTKSQTSTPESVTPAAPAKPEETGTEIASTEEIWQAVLKQLSGLTQALVKSHFQLISLEENVARIAVKTEPLLKHAQGKVNEIEAAFTSVFHRKIKVHFQVGIAPQSSSNSLSQTPVNPAQQSTQEQSLTPSIPPVNINNNGHKVAIKPEIKPNPPTISEPSPQENGNISTSSVNQSDSLSPNLSQGEVDKAAETLAKLFEGEIVILNNKLEEDEAEMDIKETQANPITHVNNQIESNLPKKESPPINKPIIRGRPDLSNLTDEDDLDF